VEVMATETAGPPSDAEDDAASVAPTARRVRRKKPKIQNIPVARIRPEDGLGRKRDREGHRDLRKSIEQFGVLTPVTVRVAPDETGDYLLIKGQGRTLACQMLGLDKIPAVVVDNEYAENEKVQQFLVENVARLRMRPVDRALLIARARAQGEETADVAKRFGVTPSTVRRLEAQLDGATKHEVAALKKGTVNLALHAVIAKHVDADERGDIVAVIAKHTLKTKDVETLFTALGWNELVELGKDQRTERLLLIAWACSELAGMKKGSTEDRFKRLAEALPLTLGADQVTQRAVGAR
jgi:ParB/RepB/Spo0J family partition protein